MKIGLVGPSYSQRSLPFDAQRTINLFPVFDEQGKEVAALYGTPGLDSFASAGSGPIRNGFASSNGRVFFVSGSSLYETSSLGVTTNRGAINTSSGNISIDENPTQMFICDGADAYVFTYSTDTLVEVTDIDFPTAGTSTYLDGYFIVNSVGTGKFFISSLNNGTAWAALDFATAESSPDSLIRVIRGVGQLWLLGNRTTEIWTNTGDSSFPFQKIKGADIEIGIMAAHTAVAQGNSLRWVGRSGDGDSIVYQADGFRPKRISTEAIELAISRATDKANMRAYTYQRDGHDFYILTGGGLETTLAYDITTNLWHERAFLNPMGDFEQHLASCCVFAFGKHLVGDRRNGNIYSMDMEAYLDGEDYIARDRIYTHIANEDERIRYNKLVVGFEPGVGLQAGQGSDPKAALRISKDGALTWSDSYLATIGRAGEYKNKSVFRRIGIAEQITFWLRITDPVRVAITGSYLK